MSSGIPCTWMRGGTSKGGFFLASDLPNNTEERDKLLLRIMGSPDSRQIDGMGGADPLTSKVAIVSASTRNNTDVDYLFLQVFVDEARVTDAQGCGNMLAGVGPFAIERGIVEAQNNETTVRIYMCNTDNDAIALVSTPNKTVTYAGEAGIDGVPGTAAPVPLTFSDIAGASCGAMLPSGNPTDTIDGKSVTLIDYGMPTVLLKASDFNITGYESREELDANETLKKQLESIRLQAGKLMNLGDVSEKSVPKMTLLAPAINNGAIMTRTFIPHRCHATIGVFCAVSVATACLNEHTIASPMANVPTGTNKLLNIEHPLGATPAVIETDDKGALVSAGMLRTTRKLFEGNIFA